MEANDKTKLLFDAMLTIMRYCESIDNCVECHFGCRGICDFAPNEPYCWEVTE